MEVSADRWKGRLDCGQTREKIYEDYLNNFFKIFLNVFIYFIIIIFYRNSFQGNQSIC